MTTTVIASDPRWAEAGLTYRQLWRWTTWGYLQCVGNPSPGSGNLRRWPESEIAIAARMLRLIEDGFTLRAAAKRARIPSVVA